MNRCTHPLKGGVIVDAFQVILLVEVGIVAAASLFGFLPFRRP